MCSAADSSSFLTMAALSNSAALPACSSATRHAAAESLSFRSRAARDSAAIAQSLPFRNQRNARRGWSVRATAGHRGHVAAAAGTRAKSYPNPIGLHALLWVGGWSNEECEKAIGESARLGYDLIEGKVHARVSRNCPEKYAISRHCAMRYVQGTSPHGIQGQCECCLRQARSCTPHCGDEFFFSILEKFTNPTYSFISL